MHVELELCNVGEIYIGKNKSTFPAKEILKHDKVIGVPPINGGGGSKKITSRNAISNIAKGTTDPRVLSPKAFQSDH